MVGQNVEGKGRGWNEGMRKLEMIIKTTNETIGTDTQRATGKKNTVIVQVSTNIQEF